MLTLSDVFLCSHTVILHICLEVVSGSRKENSLFTSVRNFDNSADVLEEFLLCIPRGRTTIFKGMDGSASYIPIPLFVGGGRDGLFFFLSGCCLRASALTPAVILHSACFVDMPVSAGVAKSALVLLPVPADCGNGLCTWPLH